MDMGYYVKPWSDIFMRYLFGREENKDLLISFINAVLEDSAFELITDVEIYKYKTHPLVFATIYL